MKSKTLIEKQLQRKRNPELIETIIKAKKKAKWLAIAGILSSPRNKKISINLDKIDKESKEGDTIIIPGKVLSKGEVAKKIRIVALSFSKEALEKLKNRKCEIITIEQEIKVNPEAKGVKILT